ncbi:MAG: DUF6265 family protein [Candidatus Thorarchaeota archaeon]
MAYSKTPVRGKDVKDLKFMHGAWQGNAGDDLIEEHWMPEILYNMTGMFRWIKKGDIFVYEIMAIVERDDTIQLLLRHFDKDFNGWEEKTKPMVLTVTELTETKAVFINSIKPDSGFLVYELIDSDTLKFSDFEPDGTISFELIFKKQ